VCGGKGVYARRTKVGHDPSSPLGDSASAPPQRAVAARGGGKNRLYRLAVRVWAHFVVEHFMNARRTPTWEMRESASTTTQGVPRCGNPSLLHTRHRREDSEHVHTSARRRYHAGAANSYKCVCGWIRSSGPHAPRPTHESRRRFASVPRCVRAAGESRTTEATSNDEGGRAISRADLTAVCCVCIKPK